MCFEDFQNFLFHFTLLLIYMKLSVWNMMEYVVCSKSNANDLKKILLNIHVITFYPLQNRLLVIEYASTQYTLQAYQTYAAT